MSLPTPDFPPKPPAKSWWKKWPLIVVLLAAVLIAAMLPLQGRPDLVIRPLIVIVLLFFVGALLDRRR